MKIILFIPARKNSKGIKNKNIVKIQDHPLINYTLDFVKEVLRKNTKYDFEYFISSDSKKIINLCKNNGFKCDYIRPKSLAQDNSNIIDAVLHAIKWKKIYDLNKLSTLVLLQPTNPLRNVEEFFKILNFYKKNKIKSLISVTQMIEHPDVCIEINKSKWQFIKKQKIRKIRRQDYKNNYYFIDGTYYIAEIDFIKKYNKFVKEKLTFPYVIKRDFPLDINTHNDLKLAKFLLVN